MPSDNLVGVMAYLTEIDDLKQHIIYPPRGMEFEPVPPVAIRAEPPPEAKPLWHQEELGLRPLASPNSNRLTA
jgi:hypothetical protein